MNVKSDRRRGKKVKLDELDWSGNNSKSNKRWFWECHGKEKAYYKDTITRTAILLIQKTGVQSYMDK